MNYLEFFKQVTEFLPYPWQEWFACWDGSAVAVVAAPTGAGKEFGTIIPWLYSHKLGKPATTRLAYALPTRSLVDQVYTNTCRVVEASELPKIKVYCLKGGQLEHGFEQDLTQPAILIGTQDQLLSRALNRGFGVSWGQRPLHCAALTNDCRWILDEIQLTGVGYTTLVQIYQHWRQFGTYGEMQLCLMSATFDDSPLQKLEVERFELSQADLDHPFLGAKVTRSKPVHRALVSGTEDVAALVKARHVPGGLSLVVLNTVGRAREVGKLLSELEPLVIHSRFLGIDREELQKKIKDYKGIIVATQVVEAGVDLDADLLITELCPWSSFVQRCGRCGRTRTENTVEIHWLDYQQGWESRPYSDAECQETRDRLLTLSDASLHTLTQIPLPKLDIQEPRLLKRDIEAFFRTHYTNRTAASHYVRDTHNFTTSVVWSVTPPKRLPLQKSLCPVPTEQLKSFCQANQITPLVWGEDGWEQNSPTSGDVAWLPLDEDSFCRGYSQDLGWTGNYEDKRAAYLVELQPKYEDKRFPHVVPLGTHLKDTQAALEKFTPHLQEKLGISPDLIEELCRCARWHDWGKAHEIWQHYAKAERTLLAKSRDYGHWTELNGYRHELASAFAAARQGAPFLSQYLIAAHHGKVRDSLLPPHPQADHNPPRRILRGVESGTQLPSFDIEEIETLPAVKLIFSETAEWDWFMQLEDLLEEYGPFKLIYLEAIIRNADVQASKREEQEIQNASNRNG